VDKKLSKKSILGIADYEEMFFMDIEEKMINKKNWLNNFKKKLQKL
jgi:hypothetical protein